MLRSLCRVSSSIIQGVSPSATTGNSISVWKRNIGLQYSKIEPENVGTIDDVSKRMMANMGLDERYTPIPKEREHLLKYQPKLEDLPPRSMSDSFTRAVIPLSSDNTLHNKYVSILGTVRMGRLMENMDTFAGWVCHRHVKVPNLPEGVPLPYTFVTIRVDKVTFTDYYPKSNADIRLSGHMSWVGRSSMEVTVWLEQKDGDTYKKITQAVFLMAARNATKTAAAAINPLKPADEEELKILAEGEERKKRRKIIQAQSVFNAEPNDFEQSLMYSIFKRTTPTNTMELNVRILPGNCRWMSDSYATNTIASFPENRNAHNKVFGGFLMRTAQEISWVSAYQFTRSRPRVKHICDISFDKPVSVSSIIRMNAYVVYTELNYVQVMTVADVLDVSSSDQVTTNVFYYTFEIPDTAPEVLPRTYHETMWYLEGRRKFKYAMGLD